MLTVEHPKRRAAWEGAARRARESHFIFVVDDKGGGVGGLAFRAIGDVQEIDTLQPTGRWGSRLTIYKKILHGYAKIPLCRPILPPPNRQGASFDINEMSVIYPMRGSGGLTPGVIKKNM